MQLFRQTFIQEGQVLTWWNLSVSSPLTYFQKYLVSSGRDMEVFPPSQEDSSSVTVSCLVKLLLLLLFRFLGCSEPSPSSRFTFVTRGLLLPGSLPASVTTKVWGIHECLSIPSNLLDIAGGILSQSLRAIKVMAGSLVALRILSTLLTWITLSGPHVLAQLLVHAEHVY